MYELRFTENALEDMRFLEKREQNIVMDEVSRQLLHEPLLQTRNKKPLRPNDLSAWELRVDRFRVFYDVDSKTNVVTIKAVGWKLHNTLFIRGREYTL